MHTITLIVLAFANQSGHNGNSGDTINTPLLLYKGTWQVTRKSADKATKPEEVANRCSLLGKYFVCQQTVDGNEGGLVIFIPAGSPGHYYTQTITPDGRPTGRADLEILGSRWTYSSRWPQGNGKITYYRTTKVFVAKNHIHFEQAESPDGTRWTQKDSGDEVRTGVAAK